MLFGNLAPTRITDLGTLLIHLVLVRPATKTFLSQKSIVLPRLCSVAMTVSTSLSVILSGTLYLTMVQRLQTTHTTRLNALSILSPIQKLLLVTLSLFPVLLTRHLQNISSTFVRLVLMLSALSTSRVDSSQYTRMALSREPHDKGTLMLSLPT